MRICWYLKFLLYSLVFFSRFCENNALTIILEVEAVYKFRDGSSSCVNENTMNGWKNLYPLEWSSNSVSPLRQLTKFLCYLYKGCLHDRTTSPQQKTQECFNYNCSLEIPWQIQWNHERLVSIFLRQYEGQNSTPSSRNISSCHTFRTRVK